jgi:mRNA-degrading endonuclease YafQ of YafQ-DinJ toxin-antitoxin module
MKNLDLTTDIEYFKERLDDAIEHLNNKIKLNEKPENIHKFLDTVLRMSSQLKIAEDALIVYKITKNNNIE